MGTGDYICVTLRGGAPWGFSLCQGEGDAYRPLQVYQVEEGGRASLAGVCEGDEVVSLNGEPCGDLSLPEAIALIDACVNCLQLLVKRCCALTPEAFNSEETYFGTRESSGEALESTNLRILSLCRPQPPRELYIAESQDETYYGETESDTEAARGTHLVRTQLCGPESQLLGGGGYRGRVGPQGGCFSPGAMVELQLSLSEHTLEDPVCTSLGSALGIEGEIQAREALQNKALLHTTTHSLYVCGPAREPLSQHGVVEITLQHPAAGRGSPCLVEGEGACGASGNVGGAPREEGAGQSQGAPASFTVSFGIPKEGAEPAEEPDSDSEKDLGKPNKHRARHARLRRSESLSDKQVKEAKSKCKRIAILLNADAPNPNNKGVLMFKRHRQRAKKYTLVSYGTGESEPEYEEDDSEEDYEEKDPRAIKFTLLATTSDSELDDDFITNAHGGGRVITCDWDTGLLNIERKLNSGEEMEQLPNTTGKGATMFSQRRQRMDEIAAEHEEMRRQGIPVEGVQEVEKHAAYQQMEERSYMQATTESQAYMDVNYHQQQQIQQYSSNMNGVANHQSNEMQSSMSNRTPQPFSVQNQVPVPFLTPMSGNNQEAMSQGEQIASRDERISTPAIKSGILQDTRNRFKGKPMFNFKQAPKVPPNPELMNLLNRSDKKLDFESATEEDYLSLGAEACNFLQSPRVKHKTPPPVAPKPIINPNSPPWSPQPELANQELPLHAGNSVPAPATASEPDTWAPQPQQAPVNTQTPMDRVAQPSPKPGNAPQNAPRSIPPPRPQRMNSYTLGERSSSPLINPMASVLVPVRGMGSALSMPAVTGKGADLFAKRQSRMEKYVVDSDTAATAQENKARSTSPSPSVPHSWKYSPNCRAPPTSNYNPIQSPSYPPGAIKQPPPSSPAAKAKKGKGKPACKPLAVIDVMKHQPYQLNASLFTYGPAVEAAEAAKAAAPKPAPAPAPPQAPNSSYQPTPQGPYQPAHSPPYQAAPQAPYQPLPPSTYVVPSFPIAAKPESISGGSNAPKPRFMAKKSSAQVWKPAPVEKEVNTNISLSCDFRCPLYLWHQQ
ncbi:unnamed protein product [Oncorhynchus mykiss]|uniref:PDZ domain-containing protein n=1 Tax=Oncorhynchus mykiss TaxID=8022 RepID=A0A060WWD5_ONCMY|nr:unnamed protein product [Oncorhynchus mykiss]